MERIRLPIAIDFFEQLDADIAGEGLPLRMPLGILLRNQPAFDGLFEDVCKNVRAIQCAKFAFGHQEQSAVADGDIMQIAAGGNGGDQRGAKILLQTQILRQREDGAIGFLNTSIKGFRNRLGGALARIRLAEGTDGSLAGSFAVLHTPHSVTENGEETLLRRGVGAEPEGVLLGLAGSNMLSAGGKKSHGLLVDYRGRASAWDKIVRWRRMTTRVRQAGAGDAELLADLNRSVQELHVAHRPDYFKTADAIAVAGWFRSKLKDSDVRAWIAEWDGSVVGYALTITYDRPENAFGFARRFCEIDQIAVSPAFRRRGIARALVERVLEDARLRAIADVELTSWCFNTEAQDAFRALGFIGKVVRFGRTVR
jgi:ribosomal protein S18 acetylase RimI-like enzyme